MRVRQLLSAQWVCKEYRYMRWKKHSEVRTDKQYGPGSGCCLSSALSGKKGLADLAEDENTRKMGPGPALTIAIFLCNKLLVLAEHPFIWAKPEKVSYVLILWFSMAISQCLPVTHKATPLWCCENLQQQSNTHAEDTLATDPSEGTVFPFLVILCPIWDSDVGSLCPEVVEAQTCIASFWVWWKKSCRHQWVAGSQRRGAWSSHDSTQTGCLRDEKRLSQLDWNICHL